MDEVAATPAGGAEDSARPDASAELSITDRVKAAMYPAEKPAPSETVDKTEPEAAEETQETAPSKAEAAAEETTEESEEASEPPRTVAELAERTGLELDSLMDLDIPTKIDGKPGTARLRDLIKSHQLEGHLNQKLMTFADEKKAFETELQNVRQQSQQKLQQIDAAQQIAQRLLDGEFANVNWEQLQATDRLEFNQKVVEYQQRQQALEHLAGLIGKERTEASTKAASTQQAYLAEQQKLLDSKLPEWSDPAKRTKDIAEMATVLNDAYGVSEAELKGIADHRQILIARDAWKWQQLQKSKPATLNKVKTAPKLLKPGPTQSKAEQNVHALKGATDRLRQSGRTSDAAQLLKQLMYK